MIKRPIAPKDVMVTTEEFDLVNPYNKAKVHVLAGVTVPVFGKRRSKDGLVLCWIEYDGVGGWAKAKNLTRVESAKVVE